MKRKWVKMMSKRNLFNGFGYAGQHGRAGKLLETLSKNQQQIIADIDGLLEDVPAIATDVNEIKPNLNDLTELVNKIKALVNVTVTFDSDGGSSVESQTIPFGTHAIPPESPTKEGCVLSDWHLDDEPFDFETPIESNITLKAVWSET